MKIVSAIFLLLCLLACGSERTQTDNSQTVYGVNHANVCTLTVVDSIGVELGDSNYVFGAIRNVAIGPGGDIFAVDWIKCTIFRYSSSGDFIQRIGRRGSGPGEMLQPGNPAILDDGSICVFDYELGWQRYDSDGISISSGPFLRPFPMQIMALDSTSVLGMLSGLSREDNYLITNKRICRWDADDPDSVQVEYFCSEYLLDAVDIIQFRKDIVRVDFFPILFTAGHGFVCVAPEPRTEPLLLLFHEDASVMDTLTLPYPEVTRTEEEILEQKRFVEELFYHTSRYTHQVEWEPFLNKPMITNLGVDSLNRIWVQRGFEQCPTFDLYDTSGEHLMTAVLPGRDDTDHWKFNISRRGILAVPEDPESYYSVYMIRFAEVKQNASKWEK
ncbi:MAG: 6-bladed beta-propeller [Candidatus Sabulitectum sp.]|nr:6-bladed beta-propeller [Candidatus Sabulitectum sp.]